MRQRKKKIKGIILVSMFVVLIFSSIIPASNDLNPTFANREDPILVREDKKDSPLSSSLNVTDFITGPSVNQTVRVYMNNKSSSINNQNGYFDISAPSDNMNLSSGLFEFNFGNNFTTDYIIEDNNALYPITSPYDGYYSFDSGLSNLTINEGTGDIDLDTYGNITSSANGLVNFTIGANFSGVSGFNRKNIIAFVLNFTYGLNNTADVTIKIKDFFGTGDFKEILTLLDVNSSLSPHDIDEVFTNENFNFINESDSCLLQFIFDRSKFTNKGLNVSLYEFNWRAFKAVELNITNQNYVALEFQLLGQNSTVNGFYAWIRTLDKDLAQNSNLTITLCRANDTISESEREARSRLIEPDLISGEIYSKNITNYDNDTLFYFEFDSSQTNNLNRSNYFIIIKSNRPEAVYSIVTVSQGPWGDGTDESEHYFLQTINYGNSWSEALSPFGGAVLDASQFKLDITRGYITSDFKNSLKIQDVEIDPFSITFTGAPDLEWGLGKWGYDSFTYPIGSESNNFQIPLTWNFTDTNIRGFNFDVNYTVEAFRTENATATYFANYDLAPQWIFNYSLVLTDSKFDNWNFTKLFFIYEDYFTAHNLTDPNFLQIFSQVGGESSFEEIEDSPFTKFPIYKKVVISTSNYVNFSEKAKYSGTYSLNLTSYNAILESNMHSYINYKGTLWETQGFMYGDNISLLLDIQDHNGLAPPNANGFANISLFYPNGTLLSYIYSSSGNSSIDGTKLKYDFDNNTILDLTKIIPLAEAKGNKEDHYSLGYFWTNGSEIGCNRIPIYIDAYDIDFKNLTFIRDKGVNLLSGDVDNHVILPYTLLAASINETSVINNPNFYSVSNLNVNQLFTYEQWGSGIPVSILMKSFQQNETVLNPEEDISFKVSIQNRFLSSLDIKFSVKLVSLANEEWIIDEDESDTKNLELFGAQGDTKDFNVTLSIPEYNTDLTWEGQNAPIRQGGVKTIISLYIEDNLVGTFESNDYSLIVNSTEDLFEGDIIALKQLPFSDTFTGRYFERDECLYLPNQSTFIYNVFDENYVSIYTQTVKKFELNLDSNFTNILFPSEIKQGEIFNITSTLETELEETLPNKLVYLQYESNGIWINTSTPQLTGANGETNFEVKTLNLNILGTTPFKLSWAGDGDYLNKSNIFQVPIEVSLDRLSLSSEDDESFIYNNRKSTVELKIRNTGNSTLRFDIDDIDIDIDEGFDYEIIGKDEIILKPGDSETIQIEIEVGDVRFDDDVEVHVEVKAVNILTNKVVIVGKTIDLDIIDTPLSDYIFEYFLFIILAILALMLFIAYYYSRHIKKKIDLSAKEVSEKRPRRGKYVKVSELKAVRDEKLEETTEEIEEIKLKKDTIEEEVLEKEKKTVDLDTLLEEEDLKKEEVSKKIPKHTEKKEKRPKKKAIEKEEKVKKIKEKPAKLKKVKKKEKKPKKVEPKKVEPKKVEPKKTTDLDTLLEEKGLKEEKEPKKVPKKVSQPEVKKIKKSSPKPLSTRQMVEKKRGKKKSRKKRR